MAKGRISPKTRHPALPDGILLMIEEAGSAVALTVNAGLTVLYWRIGKRLNEGILKGGRGQYGKQIVATLPQKSSRSFI